MYRLFLNRHYISAMLIKEKWIKWLVAIVLMVQLVSFSGLAASSILLKNTPTELVERSRSNEISEVQLDKALNFNSEINSINLYSPFQSSVFLILSNKAYNIKLKKQKNRFFNTIKQPLLVKLLPQISTILFATSS